jgi:hypothetical protein
MTFLVAGERTMHSPVKRICGPRRLTGLPVLLCGLSASALASAEPSPQPSVPPPVQADSPPPSLLPPVAPVADPVDDKLAKQQAQIDALTHQAKDQEKALTALRQQAAVASDEAPTKLLSFWGFSDLSFGGLYYDNSNAAYKVATPAHATFFSTGVNLYVKSEMTRTLSALIETRLTYTPNGFTDDYPVTVNVGNATIQSSPGTPPPNTTAHGPYSQLTYNQDGLLIERAYLEWKPVDWFGVRAGRFLTPFGIWNEDHGSPVLIGVDYPQFMNFNLVPIWQLGLEAFGSIGIGEDFRLEYAATIANSDGPSPEYQDLTNMKAFGGRLKLVYAPEPFYFRLGGYAYYSEYVDSTESFEVHLTPNLTLDPSYNPSIQSVDNVQASYDETIVTGDAEFRVQRFRLLAEFAHQTVIYTEPNVLGPIDKLLKGVPLSQNVFDTSHYGLGGYVLAAYEIPFHTKLLDFSVTPYVGYDYVVPSTSTQTTATTQVRGGLNVKPSPYVTVKGEVARIIPTDKDVGSDVTALISQVAFSF